MTEAYIYDAARTPRGAPVSARLRYLWDQVSNSYWFLPGLMAVGAIGLSVLMLALVNPLMPGDPPGQVLHGTAAPANSWWQVRPSTGLRSPASSRLAARLARTTRMSVSRMSTGSVMASKV